MPSCDHLPDQLKRLRIRLLSQQFCRAWARGMLAAGGIVVVSTALARLASRDEIFPSEWFAPALLLITVVAAGITFARRASLRDVAALIDRSAGTRDRFLTALSFAETPQRADEEDRKSTRLNSSHSQISYAVFCLKKKTKTNRTPT